MKNTAIKIVSGVLVVALVVVAALAIAGVFSSKPQNEVAFAEGDAAVNEQHMFRNFDPSTVLYIKAVDGRTPNGNADKFIYVVDNTYAKVAMVLDAAKDENGNIGLKPKDGWVEGMFYSISLNAGYEFVNEDYKGLDSFMCIVKARESTEADTKVKDGVIMLEAGKFDIEQYKGNDALYTLTVKGTRPTGDNLVFVYENGLDSKAYRKAQGQVLDTADGYTLTVEDADVRDVYDYIYINKSYDPQESDIRFVTDATEASLRSSGWYLAAVNYLYGEDLSEVAKDESKWINVKFDPSFSPGTPSIVKLNITITFKGLFKDSEGNRDPDSGSIVIKISNTLTPVFDVHIQDNDNGKSFDVSLDMDIMTTAVIEAKYAKSWSSLDEKENKLTEIANGLATLVKKITSDKLGADSAKPYTFAKWIIPIGTLPICIEDNLGFELGASFAGEVGAVATNKFHALFGVVYAGGSLQSYHNVDDTFHFDNIALAGTAGARVGLFNEVGISAYGTISVDLGIHAGVYADIAGRLSLSGDDLIALFKNEKALNIVAAYYFETGVYASLDANGKVFGFTIAKKTLLDKKFPLYKAGHKYLPMSYVESEEDDTIYMQNSYFYVVGWDVNALDIQSIGSPASAMNLAWSEFDYTVGPNLRMEDNVVYALTTDEFESYITVTSKVNKDVSKTVTIVRNPEGPTTTQAEQVFDKKYKADRSWNVMLNASSLLGVTLNGEAVPEALEGGSGYSFDNNSLRITKDYFADLKYGVHNIVVETNKGYLKLYVRVINSAAISANTDAKSFDKKNPSALVWDMVLQGNDVSSVMEGASVVNPKYYSYRESVGQFVMLPAYWDDKAVGEYTESVTLSNGTVLTVNVTVTDSREPMLNTEVYEYVQGSVEGLALDIEAYGKSVSSVSIEGSGTDNTVKTNVVPGVMLKDKAVGTYRGSVVVGGNTLAFTVNVVAPNEAFVIASKTKVFKMSSNEDVEFAATIPSDANVTIDGLTKNVQYAVGSANITIKASFLKGLSGDAWTGKVTAGKKSLNLTIVLENDLMPSLAEYTKETKKVEELSVAWDMQDVKLSDVVIEGVESYTVSNDRLQFSTEGLAYGENIINIYTPKNTMTLTVTRSGVPSIVANFTVERDKAAVAEFALDPAHLEFSYVTVDGVTVLASDYRYNNGKLYLSNELVYKLAAGTYDVHAYLSDGTKLDTKLTVKGDIATYNTVARGTYDEPYLVYTADQLIAIATYVNQGHGNACYKLMADIDMYGKTLTPIGSKDHPYTGTFFGNGYAISNLTITEPVKADGDGYAIGLFGVIGAKGKVEKLRLNNPTVSFAKSGSVSAGIVVGRNSGILENITIFNGNISAESKSWLDIKNAYFDLGAVAGYSDGGYLRNISVEANIQGKVKGLNVLGIQIGGRKSLINAGAVVGYFTTTEENKRSVKNIQVTASISCDADNNSVNNNGWYGYSDLTADEIAACIKRVSLFDK